MTEIFNVRDDPFPWALADGRALFTETVLKLVVSEFPDINDPRWFRYANNKERKLEGSVRAMWGTHTQGLAGVLESQWMCDQLGEAFGIEGLQCHFGGGGYHQINRGGLLAMHADFSMHPEKPLYRRINLLTFLTENYFSDCGGSLQLGDNENYLTIEPRFGNVVAFATSARSWHGHPVPWACESPRRSFAAYYFAPEPPPDFAGPHSTNWMDA